MRKLFILCAVFAAFAIVLPQVADACGRPHCQHVNKCIGNSCNDNSHKKPVSHIPSTNMSCEVAAAAALAGPPPAWEQVV